MWTVHGQVLPVIIIDHTKQCVLRTWHTINIDSHFPLRINRVSISTKHARHESWYLSIVCVYDYDSCSLSTIYLLRSSFDYTSTFWDSEWNKQDREWDWHCHNSEPLFLSLSGRLAGRWSTTSIHVQKNLVLLGTRLALYSGKYEDWTIFITREMTHSA